MDLISLIGILAMSFLGVGNYGMTKNYTDDLGGNDLDRQYIDYLHKQVAKGALTEEEALAQLESKWKGPGNAADYYNSYTSNLDGSYSVGGYNDSGIPSLGSMNVNGLIDSLIGYYTRNHLTGAENEQNAFNAEQAQVSRDFTEYMARNKYSMETQSMEDAGVNPAMMYGSGSLVPTAANGAQASGSALSGGNMADFLSTIVRMPLEMKALEAQIRNTDAQTNKLDLESEGIKLQNYITDSTKDSLIKFTNMAPEERRATIDKIIQETNNEKIKEEILGVELIQAKLDYNQNVRMNELIFEMQKMQNEYQRFVNNHQEQDWLVQYDKICAEIDSLYATAEEKMSASELNVATTALRGAEKENVEAQTETEHERTNTQKEETRRTSNQANNEKYDWKARLTSSVVRPAEALRNSVVNAGRGIKRAWNNSIDRSHRRADAYDKRRRAERLQEMYSTLGQGQSEYGDIK